ncbi:Bug family tripartite tricarboxylate transporter substrate binding protein [Aquabacterium sp. J223]|uniref:Bug family tripartite tricarboxylate transporter substrate binding protein n=1 Tax=Aquabacterium sp. J223 TaxID=2898431 RepID=UPI0021ADC0BA|nr:tripartite tricarboxylate transporter substrate binding protein [Aquabacterium sp. J223]UUX95289.1 tripartite tricarboxylate transporter substrate binding protein [Aquabacterium sp. J223]
MATLGSAWGPAGAQNDVFPSRPVRLVLPYSASSGPDVVLRIMGIELAKKWGQQVVVENRPGANGVLAITAVKQAKPDGYTLTVIDNSMTSINPSLYSDVPYNIDKDLTPLALMMSTPFYLMVSADGPLQSVKQVMEVARANPGKLSFGSPTGIGHVSHLAMEAFLQDAGLKMFVVPYKGTSPMLTDVATGAVSMGWASWASASGMLDSGRIKAIAVGATERQTVSPNVPTMKEAGAPVDVEASAWTALFGPVNLPQEVARTLGADFREVLKAQQVAARAAGLGNVTLDGDAAAVRARIDRESKRFKDIIESRGLRT